MRCTAVPSLNQSSSLLHHPPPPTPAPLGQRLRGSTPPGMLLCCAGQQKSWALPGRWANAAPELTSAAAAPLSWPVPNSAAARCAGQRPGWPPLAAALRQQHQSRSPMHLLPPKHKLSHPYQHKGSLTCCTCMQALACRQCEHLPCCLQVCCNACPNKIWDVHSPPRGGVARPCQLSGLQRCASVCRRPAAQRGALPEAVLLNLKATCVPLCLCSLPTQTPNNPARTPVSHGTFSCRRTWPLALHAA